MAQNLLYITLLFSLGSVGAEGVGNVTAEADGFAPSFVRETGGRGTWQIVYSSTVALFLSAWASLHLNIPKRGESTASMILRCGLWGIISFLFPEVLVFIATTQWLETRKFRKALNKVRQDFIDDPSSNQYVSRM